MTSPLVAPYAAAKAAVVSLTRANVILPGAIDTPMLWSNPNVKSGPEKIDPKRLGAPRTLRPRSHFLASDNARLHHRHRAPGRRPPFSTGFDRYGIQRACSRRRALNSRGSFMVPVCALALALLLGSGFARYLRCRASITSPYTSS